MQARQYCTAPSIYGILASRGNLRSLPLRSESNFTRPGPGLTICQSHMASRDVSAENA